MNERFQSIAGGKANQVSHSVYDLINFPRLNKGTAFTDHERDLFAGSYAPVTILVDERPDGVHLSYDRMASFLSPYGNAEALKVARDLDAKVEALLASAAS